jgi:hypothetical protein
MLRRWAAINDGPMPSSWAEFRQANTTAAMEIERRDPELVSLLSGAAPAALRLQALTGELADSAPTAEQQAASSKAAEITKILEAADGNPYGSVSYYNEAGELVPGRSGNLTLASQLEMLDPAMAAQLKANAMPAAPQQGLSQEDANWVRAEMQRSRMESLQMAGEFSDY